jgi:hypothetical protein
VLGGLAFVFSLLFKLKDVITAIIVMRIIVQFIGQSVGVLLYHQKMKQENFPYRMFLYPLPAIIGIMVWAFIFLSADWQFMVGAINIISIGCLIFLWQSKRSHVWPYLTKSKSIYLIYILLGFIYLASLYVFRHYLFFLLEYIAAMLHLVP